MNDPIGDLAYLITGDIGATCCHKGGAYRTDNPRCECRAIAKSLIEDNRDKVLAILNSVKDFKLKERSPEAKQAYLDGYRAGIRYAAEIAERTAEANMPDGKATFSSSVAQSIANQIRSLQIGGAAT